MNRFFALITASVISAVVLTGPTRAAPTTINYNYQVSFADASVVGAIGLPTGSFFSASASFDSLDVVNNAVTIAPGGTGSFTLYFGNYTFTAASDLLGGPEVTLPIGSAEFPGLAFETNLTIPDLLPGAGSYLLSFVGTSFSLTPALNTVDFRMAGVAAVPEPSTYALLVLGAGALALIVRRRRTKAL